MSDPIRIRAEPSAHDPDSMRFRLEQPIHDGEALFERPEQAEAAPLARAIFALDGVAWLHVVDSVITVGKTPHADWAALKRPIGAAIRAALEEGGAPLGDGPLQGDDGAEDAALMEAVQRVLDAEANPSIASHGGHVAVVEVRQGEVSLRMSGGCQGCASSAATLRQGVERILRLALPRIRAIHDVTDHEAGTNPYYARPGAKPASPFTRPLPPDAIRHEGGRFVVEPDYLAPRLGLDAERLRAEIRAGRVLSREERGEGADAGKVRLHARYGSRAWAAEIGPDGAAIEIPPPRRA